MGESEQPDVSGRKLFPSLGLAWQMEEAIHPARARAQRRNRQKMKFVLDTTQEKLISFFLVSTTSSYQEVPRTEPICQSIGKGPGRCAWHPLWLQKGGQLPGTALGDHHRSSEKEVRTTAVCLKLFTLFPLSCFSSSLWPAERTHPVRGCSNNTHPVFSIPSYYCWNCHLKRCIIYSPCRSCLFSFFCI